jgi:phosphonatase-like hydrolase
MFKNIKMVVFDMAGTTINEGGLVYTTMKNTLRHHKIPFTNEEFDTFHGVNKRDVLNNFIRNETKVISKTYEDKIYNNFEKSLKQNYFNPTTNSIKVMDGALPLFEKLRRNDIKVCFNTGYSRYMAENILKHVDIKIGRDIDDLVASNEVQSGRPSPYMIHKLMDRHNVLSHEVVKVGDTIIDIKEGVNAKTKYQISVLSGADDIKTLEKGNPHLIVDSVKDLIDYI